VTIAKRPLAGKERREIEADLPKMRSVKFFGSGVDDPNHVDALQEISIESGIKQFLSVRLVFRRQSSAPSIDNEARSSFMAGLTK
jgi:hypothetical protein